MKCRLCEFNLVNKIVYLSQMPLTDEFVLTNHSSIEFISDISIYQCGSCGLVQNPVDFDHEGYYESYEYSSGHSDFTQSFMRAYAEAVCDAFKSVHGRAPQSVLEIGSGDGEQLRAFKELGIPIVLGVEPSEVLVRKSEKIGVPAHKGLFSLNMIDQLSISSFDVCISSYTLDHVRNPRDYLRAAYSLLVPGGVLAFEVHDLSRIVQRGEWCLFEHEHTIYMDEAMARTVTVNSGFEVFSVNPLPESVVRANSLILISYKKNTNLKKLNAKLEYYSDLQSRIDNIVNRIDNWIAALPPGDRLVGYGAGGRGVMTLAALKKATRFETLFDSNYPCGKYLTPKTHITISGLESIPKYSDAWCLIFSFGYMDEILLTLLTARFSRDRILSLKDFLD